MKKLIYIILICPLIALGQTKSSFFINEGKNLYWQKIEQKNTRSIKDFIFGKNGMKNINQLDSNTWTFNINTEIDLNNKALMNNLGLNKLNTSYYLTDGRILGDGIIEGKDVRCRITITNLVVEYDFSRGHPSSGYLWMAGDQNNLTEFAFKNNGKKRNGWINEEQYVISSTIEKLFQQSTKHDIKLDDDW